MAIAFRAETHVVGTGSSVTGTEPTGTTQNDVLIAMYLVDTASSTLGIPTGWTSLSSGTSINTGNFRWNFCYVVRGASAPSLAFTHTGSVYRELFILSFSGVDNSNPIDAFTDGGSATTNNTIDPPAVTAVSSSAMALAIGIYWGGSNAGGYGSPTGYTIRTDNTAGNDGVMATKQLSASGSEDPSAFTNAGTGLVDGWKATLTLTPGPVTPTVSTDSVTNVSGTSADGNGTISSDGGSTITERGFCWNTTGSPTISDSKVTAAGTTGSYSATMTGLSAGATYYVRAYATNANGTGYGTVISFMTISSATVAWLRA